MRQLLRSGALLALAGAAVLAAGAFGLAQVQALGRIETGSWWRAQTDDGSVPPPPWLPEGGLWIAADPSGASAVSALRLRLGANESLPVLTLDVAADRNPSEAPIYACAASAPWEPSAAGPWSAAPTWDCSGGLVRGRPAANGTQVLFDVSELAPEGGDTLDVVFFPGQVPTGLPGGLPVPGTVSPFAEVVFAPPDASVVSVHTEAPQAGTPTAGATSAPVAPTTEVEGEVAWNPFAPAAPAAPPAVASSGGGSSAAEQARVPFQGFRPAGRSSTDSRNRLIAAFVLVDLAIWWYRLSFVRPDPTGRRPRLRLHDDPATVLAAHAARAARSAADRPGPVPALR